MNDSDEDGEALMRMTERMKESNVVPPETSEVAPAALYLTAILECVHHLLPFRSELSSFECRTGLYASELNYVGV